LGRYGTFIIERAGSDVDQAMESLTAWRDNIYVVRQTIQNDVSSTKVRLFLKRGMSVRYLLPNPVVDYIEANGLYLDDGPNASASGPTYVTTSSSDHPPAASGGSSSLPMAS
jgi:nicotinamide mononucleotide adenylyltransferase